MAMAHEEEEDVLLKQTEEAGVVGVGAWTMVMAEDVMMKNGGGEATAV